MKCALYTRTPPPLVLFKVDSVGIFPSGFEFLHRSLIGRCVSIYRIITPHINIMSIVVWHLKSEESPFSFVSIRGDPRGSLEFELAATVQGSKRTPLLLHNPATSFVFCLYVFVMLNVIESTPTCLHRVGLDCVGSPGFERKI